MGAIYLEILNRILQKTIELSVAAFCIRSINLGLGLSLNLEQSSDVYASQIQNATTCPTVLQCTKNGIEKSLINHRSFVSTG